MAFEVRPARAEDAAAIAEIYSQGIEDRVATFETQARSAEDAAPWAAAAPAEPLYSGVGEYTIYVGKVIGKLFTTNEPSIVLARRCGFRDVGVHVRRGKLDGEWRDVLLIERLLGEAR